MDHDGSEDISIALYKYKNIITWHSGMFRDSYDV